MTPNEFKVAWESDEPSTLVRFPEEAVRGLPLSSEGKCFLSDIGLPAEASPFLGFGSSGELRIPPVADVWKCGHPRYRIIGSNGYGDPVCVDTQGEGRVVYLLHDDDMAVRFMNSSVPQLAYSLLAFRTVVAQTQAINGEDAFLEGKIPPEVVDQFITAMESIDPEAIKADHFWFKSIVGEGI